MKKGLTYISMVLDRSGSIGIIVDDVIGGFNQFLKSQKECEGEALFTLAQFDDVYEIVHNGVDIQTVPELNRNTFVPRGWTALLDAIGKTIASTGAKISAMKEEDRPEKVIFVIQTDGGENSSKEYRNEQIREMIKHQTEVYNWDFVFLGANQDAIAVGGNMGILSGNSLTFAANGAGSAALYSSVMSNMTSYRSGDTSKKTAFFSDVDREVQNDAGVTTNA